MIYEVDQSIKIEQTDRDTILSCCNDIKKSILFSRKDKRKLLEIFRDKQKSRFFSVFTFSALLAILLKLVNPKSKVVVDREYKHYEDLILERTHTYLKSLTKSKVHFEFNQIGKSSPAHTLASKVLFKKKRPDKRVSLKEIIILIFPNKKDRDL